jgi:hypothetical protein
MSYDELETRRLARSSGSNAIITIRAALAHQREADAWRQLAAQAGIEPPDNVRLWEGRADVAEAQAIAYARRAGHWANDALAMAAAETGEVTRG